MKLSLIALFSFISFSLFSGKKEIEFVCEGIVSLHNLLSFIILVSSAFFSIFSNDSN